MISVCLATYNGEKYLREQLDSLIEQTYQEYIVYIRDDGSTDGTISIINDYIRLYPNKIYLLKDNVIHRGAANSFMWLLENIDSDYYMFCDQDDIWLPNKIELTLNRMLQIECDNPNIPIVIHTDLEVVDEKLQQISSSFWQSMKLLPKILKTKDFIATYNCVTGCTMMINNIAKSYVLPMPIDAPMHDHWISYICACYGIIDNIPQQTILYRQHGKNTIGAKHITLVSTIKNFFSIHKNIFRYYKTAKFFNKYGYYSIPKWFVYKIIYIYIRHRKL